MDQTDHHALKGTLWSKWKSYGHLKILKLSLFEIKILKWENGHNSLILARNEKITPLSFFQLLKLKQRKWCQFFILSKNEQEIAFLKFHIDFYKLKISITRLFQRKTTKKDTLISKTFKGDHDTAQYFWFWPKMSKIGLFSRFHEFSLLEPFVNLKKDGRFPTC